LSTIRYDRNGLSIATYVGPAEHHSPNSNSRIMIQIDTRQPGYAATVGLTMDHWIDLVCFVRELDRQGIGIISAPEVDV
jgi:hypothetical protein